MTVSDLMAKLATMPPDAAVVVMGSDGYDAERVIASSVVATTFAIQGERVSLPMFVANVTPTVCVMIE